MLSCLYTDKGNHAKNNCLGFSPLSNTSERTRQKVLHRKKQNSPSKRDNDDSPLWTRTAQSASHVSWAEKPEGNTKKHKYFLWQHYHNSLLSLISSLCEEMATEADLFCTLAPQTAGSSCRTQVNRRQTSCFQPRHSRGPPSPRRPQPQPMR